MTLSHQELGKRIAAARSDARITQEELAEQMGIDRTAVARIEKGDRKIDSLELVAISEALDVSVDHLLRQTQPLTVRFREAGDLSPATREQVEWVERFMDEYAFLKRLTNE